MKDTSDRDIYVADPVQSGDRLPSGFRVQSPWEVTAESSKKEIIKQGACVCLCAGTGLKTDFRKFATRIPIFMYLTDYREQCLKDVITQLEPGLFKKVTGLDVKNFELLVSPGVFNDSLMNDAVYKFKRYEDTSLSYTGIDRHQGEKVGGNDTVISNEDYSNMFSLQQASMEVSTPAPIDLPKAFAPTPAVQQKPMTPKPTAQPTIVPKPKPQTKLIDTSSIKVDSVLRHKAFGLGTVKELNGGIIIVTFDGIDKRFQFPGAILQGFLSDN